MICKKHNTPLIVAPAGPGKGAAWVCVLCVVETRAWLARLFAPSFVVPFEVPNER